VLLRSVFFLKEKKLSSTIYAVLAEHFKTRDGEFAVPVTIRTKSGDKKHGVIKNWKDNTKVVQVFSETGTSFIEIDSIESVSK